MKKWTIDSPDQKTVDMLHRRSDLSALCCNVLASRGCTDIEQAVKQMGCASLSDPFLLTDMQMAADTINAAIDNGDRICIYGDYDCDGIMATVILYTFLYEIGADVTWRIPERSEGYGPNENAVREMHADGVQLIVTVDNGISAIREAELIKELGMTLVITDHHQPGDTLPSATAVVDAHRVDNTSPFRLYCGAGIALLLVAALNDGDTTMAIEQAGDIAAIATVADIVSLQGENRYLVQEGLRLLENTERVGLRALREVSGLAEKPMTAEGIAFGIAPRINAAGRLASPRLAAQLLLEEKMSRARELAEQLNRINNDRKSTEMQIINDILSQLDADSQPLHERLLIFVGEGWHPGVIGIVAIRLQERYGKPCFIISTKDGMGHGSARGFGEFSVYDCLSACGDLFEKYGGHPGAGGFTIKEEKISAFRQRAAEYAAAHHSEMPLPELRADCVLCPEFLTVEEISSLSQLEPFGTDNLSPVFLAENAVIKSIIPLSGGTHTKLNVEVCGCSCDALLFGKSPESTGLHPGDVCHMMVKLSVRHFRGLDGISLLVQDYRLSGMKQSKILSAMQTYDHYRRNEPLPAAHYRAICPTREECAAVWQALPTQGITPETLAVRLYPHINYCKMRICLDIFAELGIARITDGEMLVQRVSGVKKVALQDSHILQELALRVKEESVI